MQDRRSGWPENLPPSSQRLCASAGELLVRKTRSWRIVVRREARSWCLARSGFSRRPALRVQPTRSGRRLVEPATTRRGACQRSPDLQYEDALLLSKGKCYSVKCYQMSWYPGMEHCVKMSDQWVGRAVENIREFAEGKGGDKFVAEEIRRYIETNNQLPDPIDKRKWGSAFREAERRGILRNVGYAPTASSHGSPKVLWQVPESPREASSRTLHS